MRNIVIVGLALSLFVGGAYAQRAANAIKSTRLSTTTIAIGCQDEHEPVVSKVEATATAIIVTCKADAHSVSAIPATWDGTRFTCPADRNLWADEGEALAGKDSAYCVE